MMPSAEELTAVPNGAPPPSGNEQPGTGEKAVIGTGSPSQGWAPATVSDDQQEIVLAALAAGGPGASLDPVQVQHLLFLIDVTIPEAINGPHFEFVPSPGGPVDSSITSALVQLCLEGALSIGSERPRAEIILTEQGLAAGEAVLTRWGKDVGSYLENLHAWVGAHEFGRRLGDIHSHFPDVTIHYNPRPTAQVPNEDPRRNLIRECILKSRWPDFVVGLGSAIDLSVGFKDHDHYFQALQEAREALELVPDPWVEVGDYLREAMVQAATEVPNLVHGEDSHVA